MAQAEKEDGVNLQLKGLNSYTGKATSKDGVADVIKRGEVARFKLSIADKVLEGGRVDREDNWVPYFVQVDDDVPVNYNYTDEDITITKPDPVALAEAEQASKRPKPIQRKPSGGPVRARTRATA